MGGDTSRESCSEKLLMKAAVFYQITGKRPSPLWAIGFLMKLVCGVILTIALYFMMIEAGTLTDLTSYMYGIGFLISIDGEWMRKRQLARASHLATQRYKKWIQIPDAEIMLTLENDK